MASAVLTTIGSAAFGPIGAIAGALVGGLLDSKLLKQRKGDALDPNFPDTQSSSEGGPHIFLIGETCRVRGQIIWQGPPLSLGVNEPAVSLAVAYASHETHDLIEVKAEGYIVYNETGLLSTGPQTDVFSITRRHATLGPSQRYVFHEIVSPAGEFDLTVFRSGVNDSLSATGWTDALNNWGSGSVSLADALQVLREPDGSTILRVFGSALGGSEPAATPPKVVTITQNVPAVNTTYVAEVTHYQGGALQPVDPTITEVESPTTSDVPAFTGTSYVVLKEFKTAQFGSRTPDFYFTVAESSAAVPVADAISRVLDDFARWSEVEDLTYDVSALDGARIVLGYTQYGNRSVVNMLEPLLLAYDIIVQDRGGVLTFFHPEDARVWTVPEDEWGWSESGGDPGPGLLLSEDNEPKMPSSVAVSFVNAATMEDGAVERHRTKEDVNAENVMTADLRSLVISEDDAVKIGDRLLWTPWRQRILARGTISPRFWHILENDQIATTFEGEPVQIVVTKATQGANGLIEIEGYQFEPLAPGFNEGPEFAFLDGGGDENQGHDFPPIMRVELLDLPALPIGGSDEDPGFYLAAAPWDRLATFSGARIQYSEDDGFSWVDAGTITAPVVMGHIASDLGATDTAIRDQWDEANVLDVELTSGTLSSATRSQVYAGANLALIGDEILAFTTPEPNASGFNRYTLSGLLRGRKDSEIAAHVTPGERFVLLSDANLLAVPIDWSDVGAPRHWRVLANGSDGELDVGQEFTPTGANLRPFAVTNITGFYDTDASQDWTIDWVRRSRTPKPRIFAAFGHVDLDPRTYRLEVLDGPDGATVRSETVNDAETFLYTAAMQTTDFATTQPQIHLRITRVSSWGDGKPALATLG